MSIELVLVQHPEDLWHGDFPPSGLRISLYNHDIIKSILLRWMLSLMSRDLRLNMWISGLCWFMRFQKIMMSDITAEQTQHRFFSVTGFAAAPRIIRDITDGAQTDTSRFSTRTADVSRAAVVQRGGLQNDLLCELLWTPLSLPGSLRVITPASNELPGRSCCTLESTQEAHETPTASWSSSFPLLLSLSALNYTPNLMKRKATNTRYFLFFCRSICCTQYFTPRSFCCRNSIRNISSSRSRSRLRFVGTVEVVKLLKLNFRTYQLSLCPSQWTRRDTGSWTPSDCIYQHCCLPTMALKLKPSGKATVRGVLWTWRNTVTVIRVIWTVLQLVINPHQCTHSSQSARDKKQLTGSKKKPSLSTKVLTSGCILRLGP